MSRIRCFVAAELPEEVKRGLAEVQGRLRGRGIRARWTSPETLHLTVKFLGELESERFQGAMEALQAPVPADAPVELAPRGLGAFPSPARARVLWAGLEGDTAGLARAALEVEARVEPLGVERERRPFRAHLTLGRARDPRGIRGLGPALAAEGDYAGPSFALTEFVLFESRLRPEGALHLPRLAIPLA